MNFPMASLLEAKTVLCITYTYAPGRNYIICSSVAISVIVQFIWVYCAQGG